MKDEEVISILGHIHKNLAIHKFEKEALERAIQVIKMQNELKSYIDECKSCGRGSAVEWLEKYL